MPTAEHIAPPQPLRAVFMGTPGFAATILEHVLQSPLVNVAAVYCQPDRPAGRGKALKAPEVKVLAEAHGIPVEQPLHFKNDTDVARLAAYAPDVLLVAAYGLILPQRVLDIPRLLPINVHASLLPRLRGAAPIQRAIMQGDVVTGITIMHMEAGLDSGPILMQRAVGIDLNDTSATLHDELAHEGGLLLLEALERLANGSLSRIPQDAAKATHAAKLTKAESLVDLSLSAQSLHAVIRGLTPWPGASLRLCREGQPEMTIQALPGIFPLPETMHASMREKGILPAEGAPLAAPGTILGVENEALLVACGDGVYAFSRLCPAGKKPMSGRAFYNGYLAGASHALFALEG